MPQIYLDADADLSYVHGKIIAVLGYGNQGRSQALNMRDSGLDVIVGSRKDPSYDQAIQDGFQVHPLSEAVELADILFLLIPDELMPAVFRKEIERGLKAGDMLVFASGYNIFFQNLIPPDFVDVALLAPRMIGQGVRDHYLNGEGFPCLVAVAQNASDEALERTLALAKGIGSTRMGAILSSFEEETVIDLFSEHLGGLYAIRRSFEVLIEAGYNPEAILLELYASGEGIAIAKATRDQGLWGQITLHSRTSQYGQEVTSRLTPEAEERAKDRLREIVKNIRSKGFAQEWQAEQEGGYATLDRIRAENLSHPMIQAEESLYRILKRRLG